MSAVGAGVRTWHDPAWTVAELIAAKKGRTVSVVLPALDEEATVASVVGSILPLVGGLVDDLVVLDSGSRDGTAQRARAAGARVVTREEAIPRVPPVPGKGEALWRGVAATRGDVVVFIDSDLIEPDPRYVPNLVGPILTADGVHHVKGFYRRPLRINESEDPRGGGRVTELVARPMLAALRPDLAAILQPLGGEYAATRELLESVPFAPGYGVEIGLLLDTYSRYGTSGLAQVNLAVRKHRNRDLMELGVMSRQIIGTMLRRCGIADSGVPLTQYFAHGDSFVPRTADLELEDRPPLGSLTAAGFSAAGTPGEGAGRC
ncbi:glucosyl-3-phosphoglycerate synthase [Tomitella fengzijianii]|uniref:Glucosyl-3-phosphoglycerate synthase n=1 Tax=Tomitella fengzijianii TaxID=2597660 RepID=A0A516X2C1_9ACTN|nr:glucosyl-3-phosphoglycerate synthase [Tomitella fengzijianii]QDQ97234.1 glucosyl-3-phosphoglycerate synthase [Tomitella fengzijianii]